MSFKKIKVISPENGNPPEKDHIYLGYGYSSTYGTTSAWIKKDDGSIFLLGSGGTSGGALYWQLLTGYLKPTSVSYKVSVGNTSAQQVLNVGGAIHLSTTTTDSAGSIRWTGSDFEGNTGNTSADWVSLTSRGGTSGTAGVNYWESNAQGIINDPDGNVYIGGSFSISADNDKLNVQGAITLTNSTKTNPGTIRYSSANVDFEGYVDSQWKSLTGLNPITEISTTTIIDTTYHTIICSNTTSINIYMPRIEDAINSEFVICKYGTGNIVLNTNAVESVYDQQFYFFDGGDTSISFSTDLPTGADPDNILYSITLRPLVGFGTGLDPAAWMVTDFSIALPSK